MNLISKIGLYTLTIGTVITGGFLTPSSYAQRIVNVNPALNSNQVSPDTSISGVFDGKAIDLDSVKVYLDNKDITDESTITNSFFSYKPTRSLAPGEHTVEVEYTNANGREKAVSWSFKVGKAVSDLEIVSVSHNATEPLGKKSTFLATIKGTSGATADILLIIDNQKTIKIPAEEISDGVYVATYNVDIKSSSNEGIVVGQLENKTKTVYDAATEGFIFNNQEQFIEAPQREERKVSLRPTFTNYQDGDRVKTKGFVLEGETKPNATVRVKVSSSTNVFGGFVKLDNVVLDRQVTADEDGYFDVSVPAPSGVNSGVQYTVNAIASKNGKTARPVQMILTQE